MALHSTTTDWQSKILKKEYQNWLAVGHALSLVCDGLRPYIEREMKAFHQALLGPPFAWAAQLVRCHRGGKPKWHQSDSSKWTDPNQGHWEVAKLFMSDLGTNNATVVDAGSTDCTGLVNLLFWCKYFRVQIRLVDAVRETRNTKWGHAARQELTDGEKDDALTTIRNLLQDPELVADNDAISALAEINKMEKDFDARSVERKVQADFQIAVGSKLSAIEDEIKTSKKDLHSASGKAQKKLKSLEDHQKKSLKILESTAIKIKEDRKSSSCISKKLLSLENQQRKVLEVLENSSCTQKTSSFPRWTLTRFKMRCIQSISSLNITYLSTWIVALILMGVFGYLNHNSFEDGKYTRPGCSKEG